MTAPDSAAGSHQDFTVYARVLVPGNNCPLVPDGTITVQELAEPVTMSIARTVKIANRYDQTPPQI